MNMYLLLISALLCSLAPVSAQQPKGATPISSISANTGQTWAVIVGVSDYQDPDISDLQFAHRDAAAFAKYLQSPAGGGLDNTHITLLLNQEATLGQVAKALDWLLDVVKEGDQAIIYFSGHGDVERKTISQPGYLLCWDAPSRVYYGGGALGLPMFQEIISTLSLQTKARVLVITDACRAGKLAGNDIGGIQITANNLAKQYANEVKIMSCRPEELSLEGMGWGGGRGVFSYYFLNGLAGLADRNGDGVVNVQEIERYLEDWVPKATAPHNQNPMTAGNKGTAIGRVDPAALAALQHNDDLQNLSNTLLASNDKGVLDALAKDPSALAQYNSFKQALKEGRLLTPEEQSAWRLYEQLKDKAVLAPFHNLMRRNLAAALQDEAQQAMNAYLKADPTELRKRWKFSDRHYENFPEYLSKAAELLGEEHPLYKSLNARAHYFTGLNYRLRGEKTKTPALYNLALIELQECLKLEPDAAYAYNERGLLNRRLKAYKAAIADFERAYSLSPGWILPWANLAGIYNNLDDYDNAEIAGREAVRLDSTFALAQYNLGVNYQFKSDLPAAKTHYQKAIQNDPDYALAYFNLGLIYYGENDFAQAEHVWNQYHQLVPDDPDGLLNLGEVAVKRNQNEKALGLFKKALDLDPNYALAHLSIGQLHLAEGRCDKAEPGFWHYAGLRPNDPVVYYHIALCKALREQPELAEQQLKKALSLDKDLKILLKDPNLEVLRQNPRFIALLDQFVPGWKKG